MEIRFKKYQYWLFAFIFIALSACSKKDSAKIRIELPNYSGKKIEISEQRVGGKKFIDSLYLKENGRLTYNLDLKQTGFYNLDIIDEKVIFLLPKPGEKIEIKKEASGIKIDGSPDSEKLNYLYDSLFAVRAILADLKEQYNKVIDTKDREEIANKYQQITSDYHKFSQKFVLENLTSLVSIAAIYQEYTPDDFVFGSVRDLQFFKLVSDSLTKYYPKHRHVLALKRNFGSMLQNYKVERLLSSATLTDFNLPEVSLPNTENKIKNLSEVDRRFILLNFWNEHDNISQELFYGYNNVSKQYKDDFQIYNVYMGKSLDNWKKLVKFEEVDNWINVADTSFPKSQLLLMYNVKSLPTNFLIDSREKVILARDLNAQDLHQQLKMLMQQNN